MNTKSKTILYSDIYTNEFWTILYSIMAASIHYSFSLSWKLSITLRVISGGITAISFVIAYFSTHRSKEEEKMNNLISLNAPSILFICFHKLTKYNPSLFFVSKSFFLLFSIFDSSPKRLTNPLLVSSSINYWYLF